MFNNVVTAPFRTSHGVIYQLDVSTSQSALNSKVRSRSGTSYVAELVPVLLLHVSLPRNRRQNYFLAEYPIKVNLKSETPTDDGIKYLRQSITYRFKQRFSFVLEEMGCRVDCTVVQQANVPVSETRSVKRFEMKWKSWIVI
jgi:hypothetical protein